MMMPSLSCELFLAAFPRVLLAWPLRCYSITSGHVVTGTNPASGRSATERGVKLVDNLELK
jgi:hypothetical protein